MSHPPISICTIICSVTTLSPRLEYVNVNYDLFNIFIGLVFLTTIFVQLDLWTVYMIGILTMQQTWFLPVPADSARHTRQRTIDTVHLYIQPIFLGPASLFSGLNLCPSCDGSLVCWYVGTLVRWYVGTLVRWYVGTLVRFVWASSFPFFRWFPAVIVYVSCFLSFQRV